MGDEADADWQAGLVEWGQADAKRAEIDGWMRQVDQRARRYMRQGMSAEAAEEKATNDIRREIRRGSPIRSA